MIDGGPAHSTSVFVPLAPLLRAVSYEKLDSARRRIARFDLDDLIQRYRAAFASIKPATATASRVLWFLLSEELTRRKVVPWMRHHHLSTTEYSLNQRFALMVADLRYVRSAFPDHARVVKHRRCMALFSGTDSAFHSEAAYCFFEGSRAAWKVCKSLGLTEEQQLVCMWLHSAPIEKRIKAAQSMRDRVFQLLQANLRATRRTKTFTDADAAATLRRRHRLWLCRVRTPGSAADIAKAYETLTGQKISRQVVSRQLQLVDEVIKKGQLEMSSS